MFFSEKVMLYNVKAESPEEILTIMSNEMEFKNVVKPSFKNAIINREREYPTGLPTTPCGIAIPHTDSEHVNFSQIGFATLKEPISFSVMGDKNTTIKVSIIFMLALKNSTEQLNMLTNLMNVFQNKELIKKVSCISNNQELIKMFKKNNIE